MAFDKNFRAILVLSHPFWLFEVLYYEIGHGVFRISDAWNSGGIFAGLALIFVAWILKEAQELQEEQELTV